MSMQESLANHFLRQRLLLRQEYEYDKSEYRRITELRGLKRNIAKGLCWYPIRFGRSYYNSVNQFAVEVFRSDESEEDSAFEYGRQVNFFVENLDGSVNYKRIAASVSYVDGNRMVLILPDSSALSDLESLASVGIQVAFDETSYQAMFEALNAVEKAKNNKLSALRDALLCSNRAEFREIYPVRFPWLNSSQENAVNKILSCRDVAVVHGPPGTGKTTTLVEAVYETLNRETQVLVCAQSNTAVDCICEKLVDRGVPVLRIGNPARINDKMLSFTYERQYESHALYPELWSIRKTIRQLKTSKNSRSSSERGKIQNELHSLQVRAEELEIKIDSDLFNNARVVASTLVSSNNRLLQGKSFSTLFIDEAGQAFEAAAWIPIRKSERVIFAGDYCQLPPTIKCVEAERNGLAVTLMEQVIKRIPNSVSLLTIQYRMNEKIMEFSSNWFYGGLLQAAPNVKYRGILDWDTPVDWIDTSDLNFEEKFNTTTNSRLNPDEADYFIGKLEKYVTDIGIVRVREENIDFGIISPYKAQVQYLRRIIKKSSVLKHLRRNIAVNTIDGFQGQERDVVFISLVRSNDDGKIGFMTDLRRMNVAITRARMKLVIVGSKTTLCRHKFYRDLSEFIESVEY